MATVRMPKGSASKPLRCNSSAISAKMACCAGVSSTMMGMSRRWRFDLAAAALVENLFEQDALVGDVLIDDPEALWVDGEDEGVANLSEGLEGGEHGEIHGVVDAIERQGAGEAVSGMAPGAAVCAPKPCVAIRAAPRRRCLRR